MLFFIRRVNLTKNLKLVPVLSLLGLSTKDLGTSNPRPYPIRLLFFRLKFISVNELFKNDHYYLWLIFGRQIYIICWPKDANYIYKDFVIIDIFNAIYLYF